MKESKLVTALRRAKENGFTVTPNGDVLSPRGRKMSVFVSSNGYYSVATEQNIKIKVHRFVAFMLFGEAMLKAGVQVRHLNGNSLDNRFENLALGSPSQNMMDRSEHIRKAHAATAARARRRLSEKQIVSLLLDRDRGLSYNCLAKKYGIAKSTVAGIVKRKFYKEIKAG